MYLYCFNDDLIFDADKKDIFVLLYFRTFANKLKSG